ncbi:MAG: hypothetical protein EAZ80_13775, partial [Runella slithyformis]
ARFFDQVQRVIINRFVKIPCPKVRRTAKISKPKSRTQFLNTVKLTAQVQIQKVYFTKRLVK